ncbi:dipeptidase [Actinocatenispora sera]|uniref:dipeptidase n=1 Tax=Actinocatenispora sera TaxID=390989 RepID=UPI0033C8518E
MSTPRDADVTAAVDRVLPEVRADLERLVRVPSVAFPGFDHEQVRRSAELVAELCRDAGVPDVQILSVEGGQPAVVGRIPAPPGAPTVLLYAHHDVQPVGDESGWNTAAFEPTQQGERLYGRGAADDKAGVAAHLAAIRAFDGRPPVGVTLFIEGEEECGSPTLERFLHEYAELLTADVLVLADSGNWDVGTPALTTSLRGLADCYVEVRTLEHPVHSGMYGGVVPDALTTLCRLLATLHDEQGTVAVPGLHEAGPTGVEMPEKRLREESSVLDGVQLVGTGSITERNWNKPAVTVIGIDCPSVQNASNTLVASARAKISMRLAPGQDPEAAMAALLEHLRTHVEWGASVTVTRGELGAPYQIDATGPVFDAARDAFRTAWDGAAPVDMGIGGSIPFVAEFADAFPSAAILVTGVEDPDARAHGANESLHLGEWRRACVAEALLLAKLAPASER